MWWTRTVRVLTEVGMIIEQLMPMAPVLAAFVHSDIRMATRCPSIKCNGCKPHSPTRGESPPSIIPASLLVDLATKPSDLKASDISAHTVDTGHFLAFYLHPIVPSAISRHLNGALGREKLFGFQWEVDHTESVSVCGELCLVSICSNRRNCLLVMRYAQIMVCAAI